MEQFSIKNLSKDEKVMLLKELGYDSDGIFVLKDGKKFQDIYIDENIKIENMIILPGSTIVLDNNPLSIAFYLEEHPNVF